MSATAASIWLEMPNSGQSVFTPPSGSVTPWYRKYPQAPTQSAVADDVGHPGFGVAHGRDEDAQQVLQHEAPGPRAGIDGGQDEQRLEQDGEVVPEGHHRLAADELVRRCAPCRRQASARPPAREMMLISPTSCAVWAISAAVTGKPMVGHRGRGARPAVVPTRAPGLFMVK